jgi:hypothetical protein
MKIAAVCASIQFVFFKSDKLEEISILSPIILKTYPPPE